MPGINIYEAVNAERRESLIVATAMSTEELTALLSSAPPPVVSHWKPEEFIVELVAGEMPHHDSGTFLDAYSSKVRSSDWKAFTLRL